MMMPAATRGAKAAFLRACETIKHGSLRIRTPDGDQYDFGTGSPAAEMQVNDWSAVASGSPGECLLCRAYARGLWDTPSIEDVATVMLLNAKSFSGQAMVESPGTPARVPLLWRALGHSSSGTTLEAVGNEFYMLWLDPGMSYTSALFSADDGDLQRAQRRKYDRILDTFGQTERILDFGCGWGGFAERAVDRGHRVTGMTTSLNQKGYADARLDGRAEIRLGDHRAAEGRFDGIAAIEVGGAAGGRGVATLFASIKKHLAETGTAVVQTATTVEPDMPCQSRRPADDSPLGPAALARQAARAGLVVRTSFDLGQHSAATWRAWGARLDARGVRVAHMGFKPDFIRHWRFRFGLRAAAHATGQTDMIQLSLGHA